MTEIAHTSRFDLRVTQGDITRVTGELGKHASGAALLPNIIPADFLEQLAAEVDAIPQGSMRDVHEVTVNKRNIPVEQNYWAYALRLDRGDQAPADELPLLMGLTQSLKRIVTEDLSGPYARLRTWSPTEMAVHRYDRPLGLGRHFDPDHYQGVVVVANLAGESEFHVHEGKKRLRTLIPTQPGDVVIMRGANLFSSSDDTGYLPEHSVENVGPDGRTSFMLRMTNQPDKVFPKFKYENWPLPLDS